MRELTNNTEPKNILLFTIDSFMLGTLDLITAERYPTLARIKAKGFLFDSCITASDETASSHASIMTGLYTVSHGVRYNDTGMNQSLRTMAEILREKGYKTVAAVGVYQLSSKKGFDKGFDVYHNYSSFDPVVQAAAKVKVGRFYGVSILFMAVRFLKKILGRTKEKSSRSTEKILEFFKKKPSSNFFCWLHYFDLHTETLKEYWEALKKVDDNIGRIIKRLEDKGVLDDTIVVITADHGICFDKDGKAWYSEGNIYDIMTRVPLLFYNEKKIPAGMSSEMVRSIDIFPTMLTMIGMSGDHGKIDGKSMDRVLKGEKAGITEAFIESRPLHIWAHGVRTPGWKYMLDSIGEEKLYSLIEDRKETADVKENNPGILKELREKTINHFGNILEAVK